MRGKTTLAILYRDDELLVVDKPSGLLVHRGWGRDKVVALTLARNLVGQHVFPVHRLDRGTSGALLFALTKPAAAALQAQLSAGTVDKRYLALVRGKPPESGVIDHPVPRTPKGERIPAVTHYRRLGTCNTYSLVEARPRTGRLHQIRRHLKHLGHPVIGDVNYGRGEHNRHFRQRFNLHRLALHAHTLAFDHPSSAERITATAPIPEALGTVFEDLKLL